MTDERRDMEDVEEEPRRGGRLKGFLTFFLALAVVLLVVLLAAYRDGTGFDVLRRYLHYGGAERVGGAVRYEYDASSKNRFGVLGEGLVVLSDTSLKVMDKNGLEVWHTPVNMVSPALDCQGGRAVAYDVGGTALYVVDQNGLLMELDGSDDEPLIAASVSEDGWLTVTKEKRGLKGCCWVYNDKMELFYEFNSSQRFLLDGYTADDVLAAVALGQEEGQFVSNVVLYSLWDDEEPIGDYDVAGGLVLSIGKQGRKLVTVSDTGLTYATAAGTLAGTYSYKGAYLREYDLGGDGFTVLLLNRYRSGSVGRLVTVDGEGGELGSLEVRDEILSISAAGRYVAVLYADHLVVYNQDLQTYASLHGTDYAKEVLMRPDGSALLLSAESASLFLP